MKTDEGISPLARLVFFCNCAMAMNFVQFVKKKVSVNPQWRKLMLQVQISLNVEVSVCGTWLKPLDGETAFVM